MVAFLQKNGAPFDKSDFADFYARVEAPVMTTYRGYTVYKQSFTSQGPVLPDTQAAGTWTREVMQSGAGEGS